LSIILRCNAVNTAGTDTVKIAIRGYDSLGGTTAQFNEIARWTINAAQETFVWNDKFSMNGFEPTDFVGPLDDATKQDAVADQGSSVAQKLVINVSHASTQIDATVTYIDQNNS
jgi:LPS sulfotransferase NodH